MSLLTRLIDPLPGENKLPVHAFMAAVAELKRGAPGVTVTTVGDAFNLSAGERTDLAAIVSTFYVDGVSRELIHDVLMLGEEGVYTLQQVTDRLVTTPAVTDLWTLVTPRAFQVMAQGFNGNCVLSGSAVTAQGSPDMTLAVAKGSVLTNGVLRPVTAGNVTITQAHATLPRIDIVAVDSSGVKQVRAGTPAARPAPPTLSLDDVAIAFIFTPPGDTTISTGQILDTRVFRGTGPIVVARTVAAITRNNSSSAETFLTLTLPNGLLVAGRQIRVNCGGTMLLNSGTPTVTLRIAFNGTTLFQDVTGVATADVDRLAWNLSFQLVAQADNDQALNGTLSLSPMGAKTAPTNGQGDIAVATSLVNPFNGASAVDVTTADRDLIVQWQMNVANAANEIVMEYATGELI